MGAAWDRPGREGLLSQTITRVRDESGLTRKEFAHAIGESRDSVSAVEGGLRAVSIRKVIGWARRLGLPDATFAEPLIQDQINASGELVTVVKVGVAVWAASMSEEDWAAVRRDAMRKAG